MVQQAIAKVGGGVNGQFFLSLDEDAAHADIADTRSVFTTSATPIDSNSLWIVNPLVFATRLKDPVLHDAVPWSSIRTRISGSNATTASE